MFKKIATMLPTRILTNAITEEKNSNLGEYSKRESTALGL